MGSGGAECVMHRYQRKHGKDFAQRTRQGFHEPPLEPWQKRIPEAERTFQDKLRHRIHLFELPCGEVSVARLTGEASQD